MHEEKIEAGGMIAVSEQKPNRDPFCSLCIWILHYLVTLNVPSLVPLSNYFSRLLSVMILTLIHSAAGTGARLAHSSVGTERYPEDKAQRP